MAIVETINIEGIDEAIKLLQQLGVLGNAAFTSLGNAAEAASGQVGEAGDAIAKAATNAGDVKPAIIDDVSGSLGDGVSATSKAAAETSARSTTTTTGVVIAPESIARLADALRPIVALHTPTLAPVPSPAVAIPQTASEGAADRQTTAHAPREQSHVGGAHLGGAAEADELAEKAEKAKEKLRELGEIGKESLKGVAESVKIVSEALRTLNAGSAIASLRALSQTTGTVATAFGSAGEAAKGFIEGGAAIAATIAGVVIAGGELAKVAAEDVLEMEDIAKTAGISVEDLGALKKAFADVAAEPEGLARTFRVLAVRAQEAWPEISKQVRDTSDEIERGAEKIREAGRSVEAAQDGQRQAILRTAEAEAGVTAAQQHTQTTALDVEDSKLNLSKAQQRLNVLNYGHEDRGLNEVIRLQEQQKIRRDFERAQLDVQDKERAARDAPLGEERAQLTLRGAQRDEAGAGDKTAGAMLDLRAAINGLRDSLTTNVVAISEALKGNNPQGIDLANVNPQKLFETAIYNAGQGASGSEQVASIADIYQNLPGQQKFALGRAAFGPAFKPDQIGQLLDRGGDFIREQAGKPNEFGRQIEEAVPKEQAARKAEIGFQQAGIQQRDLAGIDAAGVYTKGLQAATEALPSVGAAIRGMGTAIGDFVRELSGEADAAAKALRRLADSAALVPPGAKPTGAQGSGDTIGDQGGIGPEGPAGSNDVQNQAEQQIASSPPLATTPTTSVAAAAPIAPTIEPIAPPAPIAAVAPGAVVAPSAVAAPVAPFAAPPPQAIIAGPPPAQIIAQRPARATPASETTTAPAPAPIVPIAGATSVVAPALAAAASGAASIAPSVIGTGGTLLASGLAARALGIGRAAPAASASEAGAAEIPRFLGQSAPEAGAAAPAAAEGGEIAMKSWPAFFGRLAGGVGAMAGAANLPGAIDAMTNPDARSDRAKANDEAITSAIQTAVASVKAAGDYMTKTPVPGADIGRPAAEQLAARDYAQRNRNLPEDSSEARHAAAMTSPVGEIAPTRPMTPEALTARDAPFVAQSIGEEFAPVQKTIAELAKSTSALNESTKKLTEKQEGAAKEGESAGQEVAKPKTKRVLVNGKVVDVPIAAEGAIGAAPSGQGVDSVTLGGASLGPLGGNDPGARAAWAQHPGDSIDLTPSATPAGGSAASGARASAIGAEFAKSLGSPLPEGTSYSEDGGVYRASAPGGVNHVMPRPVGAPAYQPTPAQTTPGAASAASVPPPSMSTPWNASPRNDGVPGKPGDVVGGRDWNSGWFPGQMGWGGAAAFFGGPSQRVRYNPATSKPELVNAKGTTGGVNLGGDVYERGTEGSGNIHISDRMEPLWGDAATWKNYERHSVSAGPTMRQESWDRKHPEDNPNAPLYAEGGHITGPGTSTSDSIPAMLSHGEFVTKAASVDKVGVPFMHAINDGDITSVKRMVDGFSAGGFVHNAFARHDESLSVENVFNSGATSFASGGYVGPTFMSASAIMNGLNPSPMRFAEGGLADSLGDSGMGSLHPINLNIEGKHVTNVMGSPDAVEQIAKFAVTSQSTSIGGSSPSWRS